MRQHLCQLVRPSVSASPGLATNTETSSTDPQSFASDFSNLDMDYKLVPLIIQFLELVFNFIGDFSRPLR
jgi:hypothetical protein